MKITIKSIELHNFKRVRDEVIGFSQKTLISGGNETGKTTIYDAYLWCLFGITSRPDSVIQTLDDKGNVIHKLETSVIVVLNYNDERDVKIERRLAEKWKAKDTPDERFMGTTQLRYIDDVPYSVAAFKEKLNSLCNVDDWLTLSNINQFWSMKIDSRRRMLMSLVGDIDEDKILPKYPFVRNGITDGKKIADLLTQQKNIRKKANDELTAIPAKIQAQDVLKVSDDFDKIEEEKVRLDNKIAELDAALQGSTVRSQEQDDYEKKLATLNESYNQMRGNWQNEHFKALNNKSESVHKAFEELSDAKQKQKDNERENAERRVKLVHVNEDFCTLAQQWKDVNNREFDFAKTEICPVCGRPFTEEMKEAEYENAVAEYNEHKAKELARIQKKATMKKEQITALKACINTYEQIDAIHEKSLLREKQSAFESLTKERATIEKETWETSDERKQINSEIQKLIASKPKAKINADAEMNKQKKAELVEQRDALLVRLSARETNRHIEEEKKKLDKRCVELSTIIANCDDAIQQIKDYKKSKISIVESRVNLLFSLIHWKFYEQNITNDEEKDVCIAIGENGVDYNSTNDGAVINMGIDIINGISRAKDIYVPLFVDRKESVEKILPSEQQTIYLQCVYGEPIKVESIK
jgi:DNA repair protein SbcC/Rad50